MHKLNSNWTLWYHNPNDSNWDISSYHKVIEVDSIEGFWDMFTLIKTTHFQNGMFFLMKGDIGPLWEDSNNVDGGCWSFRVNKKEVPKTWQELTIKTLGEQLIEKKYSSIINGISISPKRSFSIIKIWNNNIQINESELLNPVDGLNMNEIMYKPHIESIDKDREKRLNRQKIELNKKEDSKEILKQEPKETSNNKESNKLDNIKSNEDKKRPKLVLKKQVEDEESDDEEAILMYQQHQARLKAMLN